MWPDFDARDLEAAVRQFRARERRFGALPPYVLPPHANEVNGAGRTSQAWLD
jgi:hypothetical protein